jgi:hypothetical protein
MTAIKESRMGIVEGLKPSDDYYFLGAFTFPWRARKHHKVGSWVSTKSFAGMVISCKKVRNKQVWLCDVKVKASITTNIPPKSGMPMLIGKALSETTLEIANAIDNEILKDINQ